MNRVTKHYADIDFAVVASLENNGCHVDFKAYSIIGYNDMEMTQPLYEKGDSRECDSIEEAEVSVIGTIKWDGCSHITFAPESKGYFHFCGRRMANNIGILMNHLYDLALELMPEQSEHLK